VVRARGWQVLGGAVAEWIPDATPADRGVVVG